jgi:REP element-mobilizing transposase RayT
MARIKRVKQPTTTWYHLIARVTNREFLLETDGKKSRFIDFLYRSLDFSGVELGTYAIMDNHVHLFVRVPEAHELDDAEILRRISVLNGENRAKTVRERWESWQESGQEICYKADRARYLRRMYDVSQFMKTLKELFTMWYNRTYRHVGTLWTDRFKSVLVEDGDYVERVRVYIEANPVRARIVDNPTDYCWSGIGAAKRGDLIAKQGQALLAGECTGEIESRKEDQRADEKETLLRCMPIVPNSRVIPFSNGKILGSQMFVTRIVRMMGFFSRRTHAWPLKEIEFKQNVFAALGYKNDFIAIIAA